MTPEQFRRVSEVFLLARVASPEVCASILDKECRGDDEIRAEVERMLRHDRDDSNDSAAIQLGPRPVETDVDPLGPGSVIGEYTVVRTLGEGGMGRVMEVVQERPRRHVALKLLRKDALSRAMLKRFDHEIRILGEMQHEGVARIYAAGWTDRRPSQPFFTMELIDGSPLTSYASRRKLGTRERLGLVADVCDAVQYAHQRGVVHRDLKPANILVGADGKPKIVDFGIARIADADMSANTLRTATGQIIGTLPYMSPEQVSGDPASVDSRTDVYALGVVLYELLSGHPPHDLANRSLAEAARLVYESNVTRLGSIDRALRGDIETIVDKALDKDPARRYASASELASDLRRYLTDQPIVARPPSAAYQLRKFASRHRAAAIAAIAIVLSLVGATISASIAAVKADHARADAVKQAKIAEAINRFLNDDLLAAVAPASSGTAGRGRDVQMFEVLMEAARRIDKACAPGGVFANEPLVEAAIRRTLGETMMRLGDANAAFPHLHRSWELRKEHLGEGAEETLAAVVSLGGALYQQAKLDEAAALYGRALGVCRRSLGPEHNLVLECEIQYANLLWRRREFESALKLFDHVYQVRLATLGPDHPQTDTPLVSRAIIFSQQGRNEEAEALMRPALKRMADRLGEDDPATLRLANNYGLVLMRLERNEEAAGQLAEILEHRRRVLGPDHYETLSTSINYGSVLMALGRVSDAEQVYRNGYDASLARYGPDHVRTLTLQFGLANALRDLHRFDEAETHYLEAIRRREATVGLTHRQTILVCIGLFEMRTLQDRGREAEKILARPVEALRDEGRLTEDWGGVELLIRRQLELGMKSGALALARDYLAAVEARGGPEPTEAATIRNLLSSVDVDGAVDPPN